MSDHTPPEDAVEAGARAYYEWATMNEGERSKWDNANKEFARSRAEVVLTAAHEAGAIVWREEHDEVLVLLREMRWQRPRLQ